MYKELIKRIENLEKDNSKNQQMFEKDNLILKERINKLEKEVKASESFIVRNNINIDLLTNGDSLKTILLNYIIT